MLLRYDLYTDYMYYYTIVIMTIAISYDFFKSN